MTYTVIDIVQSILDNNADRLQVGRSVQDYHIIYRKICLSSNWKNFEEKVWTNLERRKKNELRDVVSIRCS